MQTSNNFTKLLPVKTIDSILYIDFARIIWVEASRKRTLVKIKGQQEPIRSVLPFSALEEMLPVTFFYKCHRSRIISLMHLEKLDKTARRIYMADGQQVVISEDRIKEFIQRTHPHVK